MNKSDYKKERQEKAERFLRLDDAIRDKISRINEFLSNQRNAEIIRPLKDGELHISEALNYQLGLLLQFIGKSPESVIQESVLFTDSIVGMKNKRGYVQIGYGMTFETQIEPNEARNFAMSIFAAADAAETDEFFFSFVQQKLKITDDEKVALLLNDFRKSRADFWERGKKENEEKDGI